MLNLIQSIIITMFSLLVSLVSFIRGPILIGILVGLAIMSFAHKADASKEQVTSINVNH